MSSGFIPDDKQVKVPFFEDASAELGIKGHTTSKSRGKLEEEVRVSLGRLGAAVTDISYGVFPGTYKRYGIQIKFVYGIQRGRIDVACLPIRKETSRKQKDQAIAQALYNVRESMESAYMLRLLSPDSEPLIGFLLVPGREDMTVAQHMRKRADLPSMGSGEVVIGELVPG